MPDVSVMIRTLFDERGANEAVKQLTAVTNAAKTGMAGQLDIGQSIDIDKIFREAGSIEAAQEALRGMATELAQLSELYVMAGRSAEAFQAANDARKFDSAAKSLDGVRKALEAINRQQGNIPQTSAQTFAALQKGIQGSTQSLAQAQAGMKNLGMGIEQVVLENVKFEGGVKGLRTELAQMSQQAKAAAQAQIELGNASKALEFNRLAQQIDGVSTGFANLEKQGGGIMAMFRKASDGINQFGFSLFLITQNIKTMQMLAEGAFNALAEGADRLDQRSSFARSVAAMGEETSEFEARLQKATQGLIRFHTVQQATTIAQREGFSALAANIPALAEIATGYALATGQASKAEEIFDKLFEGIRKGEPETLELAGVFTSVSEASDGFRASLSELNDETLTAREQRDALLQVVLREGDAYIELGKSVDSAAAPIIQLRNRFEGVGMAVQEIIAAGFVEHWNRVSEATGETEDATESYGNQIKQTAVDTFVALAAMRAGWEALQNFFEEDVAPPPLFEAEKEGLEEFKAGLDDIPEGPFQTLRENLSILGFHLGETGQRLDSVQGSARITGVFMENFARQVQQGVSPLDAASEAVAGLEPNLFNSGQAAQESALFIAAFQKALAEGKTQAEAVNAANLAMEQGFDAVSGGLVEITTAGGEVISISKEMSALEWVALETLNSIGDFRDLLFGVADGAEAATSGIMDFIANAREFAAGAFADHILAGLEKITGEEGKLLRDLDKAYDDYKDRREQIEEDLTDRLTEIAERRDERLAEIEKRREKRLDDINEDLADDLADLEDDSNKKREDAQEDFHDKMEDLEEDHQKRLRDIMRKFELARLSALIDRDARALFEAERRRDEELAAEEENYQDKRQDAEERHREEMEDIREREEDKRQELIDQAEKRRQDAIEQAEEQAEEAREQYEKQKEDAEEAAQERREDLLESYTERRQDLVDHYREEMLIQDAKELERKIKMDRSLGALGTTIDGHLKNFQALWRNYFAFLDGYSDFEYPGVPPSPGGGGSTPPGAGGDMGNDDPNPPNCSSTSQTAGFCGRPYGRTYTCQNGSTWLCVGGTWRRVNSSGSPQQLQTGSTGGNGGPGGQSPFSNIVTPTAGGGGQGIRVVLQTTDQTLQTILNEVVGEAFLQIIGDDDVI